MCAAAPVMGIEGKLICAISITFPKYVADESGVEHLVKLVKRFGEEMSGRR